MINNQWTVIFLGRLGKYDGRCYNCLQLFMLLGFVFLALILRL